MRLHDLNDFLRLSEVLNLQLSVRTAGWTNIASVITSRWRLDAEDSAVLDKALTYLGDAYGQTRRRLGPLAVLHPLRATALLVRAGEQSGLLDLLTCLLHDKLEDLTPLEVGAQRWQELEERFSSLVKDIDPEDKWFLMERLTWLTRRDDESYFAYAGRLLGQAERTTELVRIKLADRLDNTLDLHVDIEDPIQGVDFFGCVFEILFVNTSRSQRTSPACPAIHHMTWSERLYQLFKNAVLMSLTRQRGLARVDRTAQLLFESLAQASIKEAQRIILDVLNHHLTDREGQRALLMEVMAYSQKGLTDRVTPPGPEHRLDGIFLSLFNDRDPSKRKANLETLNQDVDVVVAAGMALIVIFQNFLNDPDYFVRGISAEGIRPA